MALCWNRKLPNAELNKAVESLGEVVRKLPERREDGEGREPGGMDETEAEDQESWR
jgi:hypothetical protein